MLVIIPTYNEEENIGRIVDVVFEQNLPIHILVVDDNSTDRTRVIVEQNGQYGHSLFLLKRKSKLGLGSAYITGFEWALERNYDFIVEMDADFSHPVEKLKDFYAILHSGEADVVIGSRYITGGGIQNWNRWRKWISKMGSLYSRVLTGIPVKDTTAGFVGYNRKAISTLNLKQFSAEGYVFQIEMKLAMWKLGFMMKEVPIIFKDRVFGVSKMNADIIKEAMFRVLKIAWQLWTGRYLKKISLTTVFIFNFTTLFLC